MPICAPSSTATVAARAPRLEQIKLFTVVGGLMAQCLADYDLDGWTERDLEGLRASDPRHYSRNSRIAFSFKISGRTSSRMPIFAKSASQRSGVSNG